MRDYMDSITQIQTLLQNYYRAFWIPTSIYQGNDCLVSYVPIAIPFDTAYQHLIAQSILRRESLSYIENAGIMIGSVQISNSDIRVLVGPVSSIPCNSRYLDSLLTYYDLPLSSKTALRHWLTHTPSTNGARFLAMLRFLGNILNGTDMAPVDADAFMVQEPSRPSESSDRDPDMLHNSQQMEEQLLSAIEAGDQTRLLQLLMQLRVDNLAFGNTGDSYIQNLRNIAITVTVLSSRAAIRSGMDYEQALTLSDQYIYSVNLLESEKDYYPMIGSIMMDFCEQVRKVRQYGHTSVLTNSVISYVLANLYHKPTVAAVAEHLRYNPSYISHVFREDMGIPLKTWIQEQKIKEADRLLNVEHKRISEVAAALGYSSASHFQTAYKQVMGHTPGGKK